MTGADTPDDLTAHLTPALWQRANRWLARKALAEFAHERLVTPEPAPDGRYTVTSDDASVCYRFRARRYRLDHWQIDDDSLVRHHWRGEELPVDALDLILDLRGMLGLSDDTLPVYLEELTSTLASLAYKLADPPAAAEVARADFQTAEAAMIEGHPCFVANSGRLGFDASEFRRFAPETGATLCVVWLAAHRERTTFAAGAGLDETGLVHTELDVDTLERFGARMRKLGLDLADYRLIPVHPWQWENSLAVAFAGELARRELIVLGDSDDLYQPQQSVRTLFNRSQPDKHYVKTALSVLNMGFVRGLSPDYMKATPAINDWVAELIAGDPLLRRTGIAILRERAAVGYHHQQYEAATSPGSAYRKMLAALWRESPMGHLQHGERLITMAALLHVDPAGASAVEALIDESGLEPASWLRRYLDAYLTPLLHLFYGHQVVLMPHGENVILVLRDGVPQRVLLKDIGEEAAVFDAEVGLPPGVERIRATVPDELQLLSIFTDVLDCVLRFLNAILADRGVLNEETFWATVAACVADYQASAPHLADRFACHDLFAERFALSRLNGLQLRNNRQMVDLHDPATAIQLAGHLPNPIAPYRPAAGRDGAVAR